MVKTAKILMKAKAAPLWKRFFAYLIDFFLVNIIVSLPFSKYLTNFSNKLDIILGTNDKGLLAISFVVILSVLFYFVYLEFSLNQTVGKMLLNIYVVSVDGNKLKLSQAFVRNLIKPFPIVLLVDVLYMFFKRSNQRLFEVFSATSVVEKEMIVK